MKTTIMYLIALVTLLVMQQTYAQEDYRSKMEKLEKQKERITVQEKDALKIEVEQINKRLANGDITNEEAELLKKEAATDRALNIENRLAIIDNQVRLLERNKGILLPSVANDSTGPTSIEIGIMIDGEPAERFLFKDKTWKRDLKYDRRTSSDFVLAIGLNNALVDNRSLNDSPYKVGGSRFFEMGWQWRTRVFQNTNFLRLNYGFSFQFNGLKPVDNQYFVLNGDETELQEFPLELNKSKLRMDNLVFPLHFEFGPSKVRKTEKSLRYNIDKSFRLGIGGYGGFNIGTRQKLKYSENGDRVKDKLKRDYNTNDFIYGLSAYAGFGGVQLYMKYDLNPIFKDAAVEQRNISLGLRFDL
ncbi:hypothetical protein ACFQZJ_17620 [Maribacter chungangensis]|uniref:PorT family protein n=1 Tax=Maribacter chungangensis TaxID=1069117 RepID=A0ABW3B965_9FLAO